MVTALFFVESMEIYICYRITLSVGQLTVGVTIPEWSGVLMLSNMKSRPPIVL